MGTAPIKSMTAQKETRVIATISTVTNMATNPNSVTLDFQTIKARQKATWEAGDFGQVAKYIVPVAEEFMARLNLSSGQRVLDAACGTGNLAVLAARAGCAVSGVDIASNLVAQARVRAHEAGLTIDYTEGDAESLPYPDASFDLVVSMFGVMFAPSPERVVHELMRVTKPGGFIALANWTSRGFIGKMFEVFRRHIATPVGSPSPLQWGDEDTVRERLHPGFDELRLTRRIARLHFPFDPAGTVEFFRQYYGPTQRAFDSLASEAQAFLRADLEQLQSQHNVSLQTGETDTPAEYLEICARRAIDG
jgi:2-polyprenyl-3-methyl-5-hydroxy-6-metoxy-1,4-benzoquinol methylase